MGYSPREWAAATPEPLQPAAVRWDETRCLLCNGPHAHTLIEAPDFQGGTGLVFAVVQCDECGLCFTNPRPDGSCLAQFYPNDYRPHQTGQKPTTANKPGLVRGWLARLRPDRSPIPWTGQGRLLDFGCGGGAFLTTMQGQGWTVTGLDTSAATVLRLRTETGMRVLLGTLPHPELQAESFDLITMWHALEHVPDPRAVLREARRLLTPEGRLLIAVPNIDSLAFRVFGQHWFGLDVPRHLTHFTPWTLHLMLERTGFRVESIRMVRHSAWLRHSARLACGNHAATLVRRGLKTKLLSRLVAFYSWLTHQSDCVLTTARVADVL